VVQVLLAQQGWPGPPQEAQVPVVDPPVVWHSLPGRHTPAAPLVAPRQQGWLMSPQGTQVEVWQTVLSAVHRLPVQHALLRPPQVPQAPALQMPVIVVLHWLPSALHVLPPPVLLGTQQPPPSQRFPGQHASPGAPQELQYAG
jgi:hypothetical protein